MKPLCFTFALLLSLSACRSGVPPYSAETKKIDDSTLVVKLESSAGLNPDEFRKAVLTEAAHAAIERGATWLRIDTLSLDSQVYWHGVLDSPIAQVQTHHGAPAAPGTEPKVDVLTDSGMTRTRTRTAEARITIGKDALPGEHVFDAAKLLDDLREGRIPPP